MAAVLKTAMGRESHRGFESHTLRQPRPGAFHDPDLLPPGVCGSLRRKFVHPVKPVAQPTRYGGADGVGLVGVDLDPGHVGQGQPRLGQSPRARGGIATPDCPGRST